VQHGGAESLREDAAIEMLSIQQALGTYAPQYIFNCDETSLYWRLIPDHVLSLGARKKNIVRISGLLSFLLQSNASERLPVWFIGTAKKPRAFAAAELYRELGCVWCSNRKAWMAGEIFKE
jgi:hypothetical protein